jgi:predicted dehydrogenase
MSPKTVRVLVVGLGTIARTHLEVLRARPDVELVGGVDPRRPDTEGLRTFASIRAALDAGALPDLAVVATPTDTHLEVVGELLDTTTARVLCEKPLARDVASLERLVERLPTDVLTGDVLTTRLAVAHHFAFSPEVEGARELLARNPHWGAPTRVTCVYNDAYGGFGPERRAVYVSSWVDSGPNQLSVLAAFTDQWRVRSHLDRTERSVTNLDLPTGTAHLVSNWLAADSSKQTHVELLGGEVELRLDHTSMTVVVREGGEVVQHTAYAGSVGRKHAHYRGVYETLLRNPADARLGLPLATRIAQTLEEATSAPEPVVALSSLS